MEYIDSSAEPQFEQSRIESNFTRGAARSAFDFEGMQLGDEEEPDAEFELALDEVFSELGS